MITDFELMENLKKAFPISKPLGGDLFYTREDYNEYDGNILKSELLDRQWDEFVGPVGRKELSKIFGKNKLFPFLTPLGYSYFLPAFLLYMLAEKDHEFLQFCMFNIFPDETEESLNRVGCLYNLLNDNQIEVLKKLLSLISEQWVKWGGYENDAKIALTKYWEFM